MKKVFVLLAAIMMAAATTSSAQEMSPYALGIKFGGSFGDGTSSDVQFSFQKALSQENRLEVNLDLSFGDGHSGFGVAGYYQWVWNIQDGLNWYAGPGASLGFVSVKNGNNWMSLGIGGQVGLEYRFKFPLQLTLDVSPYIGVLNSEGFVMPLCLGVRYMF